MYVCVCVCVPMYADQAMYGLQLINYYMVCDDGLHVI